MITIAEPAQFEAIYARWAGLHTLPPTPGSVFLRAEFLLPLLSHFAPQDTGLVVIGEADRPDVLIPVTRNRPGWWQTLYVSQMPVSPILGDVSRLDGAFVAECARHIGAPVGMLRVFNFDAATWPGTTVCEHAADVAPYCDTFHVDLGGGFDDYWNARSKNLRSNIRRYRNRATKGDRQLEFRALGTPDALEAGLGRYAEIESAGWKGDKGTAIRTEDRQGRFYAEVLRRFAETDDARIYELTCDGVVIASRIIIRNADTASILKTTYREDYSELAPGRMHLFETLQSIASEGYAKRVEFFTKMTKEQSQWSSEARPIVHVDVFRNRAFKALSDIGGRAIRALRKG